MPRPRMTYDIALAVAKDAANDNMRKHGRSRWNEDDTKVVAETLNRLYPVERELRDIEAW